MEKVSVKSLYKNNRYKVICSSSNYYLIDIDSSWLGYIFFGLNWLVPQKVYILEERDADDLLVQHIEKIENKNKSLILLVLVGLIFNLVLPILINHFYINTILEYSQIRQFGDTIIAVPSPGYSILLLLSVSITAVIIRINLTKQSKKKILNKVDYTKLPAIKIRIMPFSVSIIMKSLAVYILFVLLIIATGFLIVIFEGYWIISFCFSLILLFFLLTNYLSMSVGTYKIRKSKEK